MKLHPKIDYLRLAKFGLPFLCLTVAIGIFLYFKMGLCADRCSYESIHTFLKPIYQGSQILFAISAFLLFVPPHIFRKWLFYIAPVFVALTVWQVQDISVYAGGMLVVTRTQMAQIGMIALGAATLIFVLGHLGYDYWKKKKTAQK